jgi:phosphatidate cytidylyltransferase
MTWKRVATAAILIPVVVAIVLFTPTYVVGIATGLITVLALREYFALGDAIGHRAYRLWTITSALLILTLQTLYPVVGFLGAGSNRVRIFFLFPGNGGDISHHFSTYPANSFIQQVVPNLDLTAVLFLFVLGLTFLTLSTRRPIVESLPAAGISSSALLLVAFPLSFAVRLHGGSTAGPRLLLFALVITWAADTFAYFAGRAFGKHPLAPHISPKKTWEGSAASMIGSLLVAHAFSFWIKMPLPHLFAMAVLGNIAGQMGDLLESAYKRSAGVKDSGGLLPGHGGVLDRIDALILCIPVIWYYLVLVNPPLR